MGSVTVKVVACVRGNAVTSPVLMWVRKDLPPAATMTGYDRDKIRKMLAQQGIPLCIPPRRCRKKPVHYSKKLDGKGHKIETLFSRQKDWQPIAIRCARIFRVFRSAILLAATALF